MSQAHAVDAKLGRSAAATPNTAPLVLEARGVSEEDIGSAATSSPGGSGGGFFSRMKSKFKKRT